VVHPRVSDPGMFFFIHFISSTESDSFYQSFGTSIYLSGRLGLFYGIQSKKMPIFIEIVYLYTANTSCYLPCSITPKKLLVRVSPTTMFF
jgi:hypothetical protein